MKDGRQNYCLERSCLLLVALLAITCGCRFASKPFPAKLPWAEDREPELPDRLLPVWTDSILHQPNQPGIRGFGGRIYFYEKGETDPAEVDGGLAVYVFDADEVDPMQQKPLRKFVFTADQFETHMSRSSIGPSYSVWLPWGPVGGPAHRLSLIARFEGREGGTVISEPTIKLLPGIPQQEVKEENAVSQSPSASPYQLISHSQPEDRARPSQSPPENNARRTVETIDLPPSFQRHLQQSPGRAANSAPEARVDSAPATLDTLPRSTHSPQPDSDVSHVQSRLVEADDNATQTTVYDARSRQQALRNRALFGNTRADHDDIRKGRWIEPQAR